MMDDAILQHIDGQMERLFDPLRENVKLLKQDMYGNGKVGLKSDVQLLQHVAAEHDKEFAELKMAIEKLNNTVDHITWKLAGVMTAVTIVSQIVFSLILK